MQVRSRVNPLAHAVRSCSPCMVHILLSFHIHERVYYSGRSSCNTHMQFLSRREPWAFVLHASAVWRLGTLCEITQALA